ncbi:MAG: sensor histidine kinase [Clostridiales bacterium]|nr:sensor histidine kinase [Clostridiales bacterium]
MKEISLHILDLAQNSIRAGAKTVAIALCEDRQSDTFTVTIEDDGTGMSKELAAAVLSPFVTTRTTRKVGLGIPLFAAGCENCEGSFTLESTPGKGTKMVGTYRLSHIDRPPLGAIWDTIVLLIQANPLLRFCYTHTLDGQGYALDTSEVRTILGEVPLDTPEVTSFLTEFIRNNEQELREVPKP